jgi:hypothetical protein
MDEVYLTKAQVDDIMLRKSIYLHYPVAFYYDLDKWVRDVERIVRKLRVMFVDNRVDVDWLPDAPGGQSNNQMLFRYKIYLVYEGIASERFWASQSFDNTVYFNDERIEHLAQELLGTLAYEVFGFNKEVPMLW